MNGTQIGIIIYLVTFIATGWVMEHAEVPVRLTFGAVLLGMTYLAMTNQNPLRKMWFGPTKEAMEEELRKLDAADSAGVPLNGKKYSSIEYMKRKHRIYDKLKSYSEANKQDF